jgi:hypothetical protein
MQLVCHKTLPKVGKKKLNKERKQWLHAIGDAYHTSKKLVSAVAHKAHRGYLIYKETK